MTLHVFFLVLLAALLHASWNAIVKGGSNKIFEIALNSLGGGIGAILILPFVPFPHTREWLFLALSCLAHVGYYYCVAATYRAADLTLGYPIMRGTAPVLTALILTFFGAHLPLTGWTGIMLICAGILLLAAHQICGASGDLRGIFLALRTSLLIAAYTLADGYGARISGESLGYTAWLFFLNALPIHFYIMAMHGQNYLAYLRIRGKQGICGGFCGLASYGIAIWAMTVAPIALVAALRETSVLFGLILAVIFIGERVTLLKILATCFIVAGAIAVRMG